MNPYTYQQSQNEDGDRDGEDASASIDFALSQKTNKNFKKLGSGESLNCGDSSQHTVDFPGNKILNKLAV